MALLVRKRNKQDLPKETRNQQNDAKVIDFVILYSISKLKLKHFIINF